MSEAAEELGFDRRPLRASRGWTLALPSRWLALGGVLSGFFGGLSGNQGALRSAFLLKSQPLEGGFRRHGCRLGGCRRCGPLDHLWDGRLGRAPCEVAGTDCAGCRGTVCAFTVSDGDAWTAIRFERWWSRSREAVAADRGMDRQWRLSRSASQLTTCAGMIRFRASLMAMRRISWIDHRISGGVALLWPLPVVDVSFFWAAAD